MQKNTRCFELLEEAIDQISKIKIIFNSKSHLIDFAGFYDSHLSVVIPFWISGHRIILDIFSDTTDNKRIHEDQVKKHSCRLIVAGWNENIDRQGRTEFAVERSFLFKHNFPECHYEQSSNFTIVNSIPEVIREMTQSIEKYVEMHQEFAINGINEQLKKLENRIKGVE
jgi:hypothetical protein